MMDLMKRFRLNDKSRELLADKLMDTANYAVAAMVFALIAQRNFDLWIIGGGLILYLTLMIYGVKLRTYKK